MNESIIPTATELSRMAARKISQAVPQARFCGFRITPENRKQPVSTTGPGVSRKTPPTSLIKEPDEMLEGCTHFGLVMQNPVLDAASGFCLVALDIDTKRATNPKDIRIARLVSQAKELGLFYERSHSGKGAHIIFLTPADDTLPGKIYLGQGLEIEVFGMANSPGKSLMLSGDNLSGDVIPLASVRGLLNQAGITDDVINPPKPKTEASKAPAYKSTPDIERAKDALSYINPSLDYDNWISVGMSLKAEFGDIGMSLWDEWSSGAQNYDGDLLTHWRSFNGQGITAGTLYGLAKEAGWNPSTSHETVEALRFGVAIQPATDILPAKVVLENPELHPLTQFIDLTFTNSEPEWLIDDLIQVGVVTLAGTRGVGKTSSLLPMAASVAHLCPQDYELKPSARRHVIWVTEDALQVERALAALIRHAHWATADQVRQWFHVVEARRMSPELIGVVSDEYASRFSHDDGITTNKPLVVFDTSNACFDLENENSSSEVGEVISMIKERFKGFPVIIVTHVAKTANNATEVAEMTSRGSGAWESDANQCLYLINDKEQRFLLLGKRRFETDYEGLEFDSFVNYETITTNRGIVKQVPMRYSIGRLMDIGSRKERKAEEKEETHQQFINDRVSLALSFVQSIINDHPEGVIMSAGKGKPSSQPPGYYRLTFDDILDAVPSGRSSAAKAPIREAVKREFFGPQLNNTWVVICNKKL